MQAAAAAKIFHDWASSEGLMPDGGVAKVSSGAADFALLDPLEDAGKQILRRRAVVGIIFSETEDEIVVLTKLAKPTKKELSLLPSKIDDVAVSYRQGAPSPIGGEPPRSFGHPPFTIRQVGGMDRYACGGSVSQGNSRDAGTMGCLVRDANGVLYGLSNNHVTGGCSHAPSGLPILAPGVLDVAPLGHDPFTIGYHERALDMVVGTPDNTNPSSNSDAAIFKIVDENRVSSFQGDAHDTPASCLAITAGMKVEKFGRTTALTSGIVVGQYYGSTAILYHMEIHNFKGRVFFDPVFAVKGHGGAFADAGDSGALVTTVDGAGQRHAVGIVVGGMVDKNAPGGILTFVLPIDPILQKLAVALISGHQV
jgi:hypothetical protein